MQHFLYRNFRKQQAILLLCAVPLLANTQTSRAVESATTKPKTPVAATADAALSATKTNVAANATTPTPLNGTGRGRIGHATFTLRDFDYNGLAIESATINADGIAYSFEPQTPRPDASRDSVRPATPRSDAKPQMRLVSVGTARAHLVVPASSLQTLLQSRLTDVKDARLSLQDGRVRLTGTRPAPVIGIPVAFTLSARLELREGREIWLQDPQISLGETRMPSSLIKGFWDDKKPVYVFEQDEKWPFRLTITSLAARNDKLELDGDLFFTPPPTPNAALPYD